jgi:hypothetical protein
MIHLSKIAQLKPCFKCAHFIGDKTKDYGKCKMFSEKDTTTGKVIYHYASVFRIDMLKCSDPQSGSTHFTLDRCGTDGKYFIKKTS